MLQIKGTQKNPNKRILETELVVLTHCLSNVIEVSKIQVSKDHLYVKCKAKATKYILPLAFYMFIKLRHIFRSFKQLCYEVWVLSKRE